MHQTVSAYDSHHCHDTFGCSGYICMSPAIRSFCLLSEAMSKNICEEMDRKLGKIVDSPQIPKPCDTKIQLLQGEALLIPRIPTCPISTFDVQFTGAMKDPISNSVVTTDLLYENQRLFVEERRIIPNGLRNNAYTITRSLQMSEDADHAKIMVSVACQLLDQL